MMKVLVFNFLTILYSLAMAGDVNPSELRKKFYASIDDAPAAKLFLSELESVKGELEPIQKGYKAAIRMVMAKHVLNPYNKFKYFLDGKNELEAAILINPKDIELRLIRFAIQSNVPGFLGYNSEIKNDKQFLMDSLQKLKKQKEADAELIKIMKQYLNESKYCTEQEKSSINKS